MTWFDFLIFFIVIASAISGFVSGFIMQLASLVGLIAGAFFAGKVAVYVYPFLEQLVDIPDKLAAPLSFAIAFILIIIVFAIMGKLIDGFFKVIKINFINRLGGSIFSVAKWLVIVSILLNITIAFDKNQQLIKQDVQENSITFRPVKEISLFFIPFLGFDFEDDK
ncbi:CvpA family protein [Dysgonomonas sp. 216]|uniref:CvpA family protein n=1 Tax=Dysgonomonas sp. 216 TaxID=2302934 RepID=UPI0013D6A812|nr:CvpA family protein [Dysgonomonas sp. 216]NDW17359.1 CvpA family protein [Dysgonomonas sp. 216]